MATIAPDLIEMKSSVLAGYVKALREVGALDQVLERVSPEIRDLMLRPPFVGTWLPASVTDEVVRVFSGLRGVVAVAPLAARSVDQGLMDFLKPMTQAALAIGGASPMALFKRLNTFTQITTRGVTFACEPMDAHSCRVILDAARAMTVVDTESWRGSLSYAFVLCQCEGEISAGHLDSARTRCSFTCKWQ